MRPLLARVGLAFLALLPMHAASAESLCRPLRAFVESVQSGETRELTFRTRWGGEFKDEAADPDVVVLAAKRCEHHEYLPAKVVCDYWIEHGATEFSDGNFMEALACLSRKTRLDPGLSFGHASVSLTYGTEQRGANVVLEYMEDTAIGGMALKVSAVGY